MLLYSVFIFTSYFMFKLPINLQRLVDIKTICPSCSVELKYASTDNFTGKRLYNFSQCLVLKEVALQLYKVQLDLEKNGLGLKIWDGFRPLSVQVFFWDSILDKRYVSPPQVARHTRGTAIDVTLTNIEGKLLAMPSLFDDFSERAHRNYRGATHEERTNSALLENFMTKHGFIGLSTEWWHFDLCGWEKYPIID